MVSRATRSPATISSSGRVSRPPVALPSKSCKGCCSAAIVTGAMRRLSSAAGSCVTAGTSRAAPTASPSVSRVRSSCLPCSPTHRASTCCASRRRRRPTTSPGSRSRTFTSRCDRPVASRCWRTATARRPADPVSPCSSSTWRGRCRRCPIRTRGTCSIPISVRRPSARCERCSPGSPTSPPPSQPTSTNRSPFRNRRSSSRATTMRRDCKGGSSASWRSSTSRFGCSICRRGNISSVWRWNDRAARRQRSSTTG